ncbi:MAG TPA: glycosyl hydrolase [Streptosporangiaceae bacterium]|nr:glycosyl hydrolase [Streptosporangiaceae bacterium]
MTALSQLGISSPLSYLIAFGLPALDAVLPVVPSETAVIALGVTTAGSADPRIALLLALAAAGAFAGDNLAYFIGSRFQSVAERRFFAGEAGARRRARIEHSLDRFGARLILACRFIPGGRTGVTVTCGLVGYRRDSFVAATACAGVIWASYAFFLGRLGGKAFEDRPWAGLLLALAGTVVLGAIVEVIRRIAGRRRTGRGHYRHRRRDQRRCSEFHSSLHFQRHHCANPVELSEAGAAMPWKARLAAGVAAIGCAVGLTAGAYAAVRPGAVNLPGQTRTAAAADAKKGVSVWAFNGLHRALAESGASWYFNWMTGHPGLKNPRGVQFVPMIWGAGSVTKANLRQVRHEGHYLLGFNEPDNSGQANMTVTQALNLWPRLMATGMTLGSPAVATGAATAGGWLDQFMSGAAARHYRVNFIAVHWYGGDFTTGSAVQQLEAYLRAIHSRYHLPIWLTEFALIRFGATTTFPSARQQAAFVTRATAMLQRLKFVQRYAWFALPATPGDGSAGLFAPGAKATRAGRAFEAAGS